LCSPIVGDRVVGSHVSAIGKGDDDTLDQAFEAAVDVREAAQLRPLP